MGVLDVPPELAGQSGLYNIPDPLLRRLRLEDQSGRPILDLDKFFKEQEVLIIYAGSEQGSQNLKELHRNLTGTALKNYKTTSILYVSTDTDPKAQQRITKDVPWLRMTFNDNSDFAPLVSSGQEAKITEIEDVERGEDFIQAGEIEVGAEKVSLGEEEYPVHKMIEARARQATAGSGLMVEHDYVRPLSRAALTCLMRAYSTPSLSVYHIPSHTFVARNLRKDAFSPKNVDENLRTWRNGGAQSITFLDVVGRMKWAMLLLALSAIYRLVVMYGGDSYNVVPAFIDQLRFSGKQK